MSCILGDSKGMLQFPSMWSKMWKNIFGEGAETFRILRIMIASDLLPNSSENYIQKHKYRDKANRIKR